MGCKGSAMCMVMTGLHPLVTAESDHRLCEDGPREGRAPRALIYASWNGQQNATLYDRMMNTLESREIQSINNETRQKLT